MWKEGGGGVAKKAMSKQSHNANPQSEDGPEFQVEQDLYSLFCTGKQLLGSDLLPQALAFRLEELVRGIAGCKVCEKMLGEKHDSRCGIMAGQTVLSCDLASKPSRKAPSAEIPAF